MKKFILGILISFFTLSSNGQTAKDSLNYYSPEIEPFIKEIIYEGAKRGYEVEVPLRSRLNNVVYAPMESWVPGRFYYKPRVIVLNMFSPETQVYHKHFRIILYHEVGHVFKQAHTCSDCLCIMSSFIDKGMKASEDPDVWETLLDDYFYHIMTVKYD